MPRPNHGHLPLTEGSVFGGADGQRFQIQNEAGRGGQAVVFKALDTRLSRPFALKLCVAPDGAARRLFMERFERELQLTSRVNHPHVLQLYDCGELPGGFPYVMLEWMEHGSLSNLVDLLRQQGRNLPMAYAAYYGRALAAALQAVHAADIVHRDVKPDNVLVGRDGVAKLTDFGIAKDLSPDAPRLTEMGLTMGTPGFMAPEQLGGLPGPISDVFSFGVTLYVLLTGQLPDQETSANRIPLGILRHETFEGLPAAAVDTVRQLTAFEVEDRPQSFREVLKLLATTDWSEVDRSVPGRGELPPLPSGVFVSGSTSVLEVETLVAGLGGAVGVVTGSKTVDQPGPAALAPPTLGYEDTMDLTIGEVQAEQARPAPEPGHTRPFPAEVEEPAPEVEPEGVGPTRAMPEKKRKRKRKAAPEPEQTPPARSPIVPALIGLGVLVVGVVILLLVLRPAAPPTQAELLVTYERVEAAAAAGDWTAAASAIEALPEAVLEDDAGKLLVGLDAYLAGDYTAAQAAAAPLAARGGRLGSLASLLAAGAARLEGEGDYDSASTAYAAAAGCEGDGCAPLKARGARGLAEVCLVSESAPCPIQLGAAGRDRLLAASVVLLQDGHARRAASTLQAGLGRPASAAATCGEMVALRRWAPAAAGLEATLRQALSDAARAAAREPADCVLFPEGR
jgi:hypothetical protein